MLFKELWQDQDGDSASILGLLDLSSAFNTFDHGILLDQGLGMGITV